MKYEVKTKQGNNFIVDDDSIELWLEVEEMFDKTFYECAKLIERQSLSILTKIFFAAAVLGGHTELKTHRVWATTEFESFDLVENELPKAE